MFQKMGLVFFLILISASLSSCEFATNTQAPNTQTPNTLVNACDPINGVQNIISTDQPQILVFGEVHGTKESPEFIGDVVCHIIASGQSVTLAIEFSNTDYLDVQKYLDSESSSAESELLTQPYWIGGNQDGKRSLAMFDLFKDVKSYRAKTKKVDVIGFDIDHEEFEKIHRQPMRYIEDFREKTMANDLLTYANANPERRIVVLTGNLHSGRSKDESRPKMVDHIGREKYLSFDMRGPSGTVWTWIQGETKSGNNIPPNFLKNGSPLDERALVLVGPQEINGHDGFFYIVSKSVSRPTNTR